MQNMKEKFNELFYWFEDNEFKNEGSWCRSANLIFEFIDWIEKVDDETLGEKLGLPYDEEKDQYEGIEKARHELKVGCDSWLMNNIKNIF